ncbi:prepilin-type N-terminal cleavage/methylation domain-containing protein [Candidatus Gracilibacteria bacterium]|nr:prepilin-type N-terminal cleavage/methylation domain-containing protein [Candidatus Gracilibacteria bacterium]
MRDKKAFTLIELIVSISILVIVMMFSYAPYNLYQNRAKVKLATREVAQSLYEAKNMAISGVKGKNNSDDSKQEFKNKSVGVFLTSEETKDSKINFYYYDYNISDSEIVFPSKEPDTERQIQDGVTMTGFSVGERDYSSLLLFYESVTGKVKVYGFDASGSKIDITENGKNDDTVKIKFTYKKATTGFLQKEIKYYLKTNIVDYK